MAGKHAGPVGSAVEGSASRGRHAAPVRRGGRHRIEDLADPTNTGPLAVVRRGGRKRAAMAATGALMIVGTTAASGQVPVVKAAPRIVEKGDRVAPPVVAAPVAVTYAEVEVRTVPAPPPPVVVEEAPPPPPPAPVIPPPPPAPPVVAAPPPPPPVPVVPPGKAAGIAAAAWAQVGAYQDCTMLATNALAAVGIYFHDWPAGYFSLGHAVTPDAAVPGDLVYYANGGMGLAHIAVYVGNGMAIHGGWEGNRTVSYSVNIGSGPVFIRVH